MDQKQLFRVTHVHKYDNPFHAVNYTTGDDQSWTYKYTWEDYLVTYETVVLTTGRPNKHPDLSTMQEIRDYFIEHPEELMGVPELTNFHGLTRDEVVEIVSQPIPAVVAANRYGGL